MKLFIAGMLIGSGLMAAVAYVQIIQQMENMKVCAYAHGMTDVISQLEHPDPPLRLSIWSTERGDHEACERAGWPLTSTK